MCKIWEFTPQGLASVAWAFATLAIEESELPRVVRPAAVCKIWELNPQGLSNTVWALATLAVADPELLVAVRPTAVCKICQFNPQIWEVAEAEALAGIRNAHRDRGNHFCSSQVRRHRKLSTHVFVQLSIDI